MPRLPDAPLPRTPLLALARLLAGPPHADAVEAEVALAADDPEGYAVRFEDRMFDRGLSPRTRGFAWIALVDALQAAGRAAELDWKEDAREVEATLDRLAARPVFAGRLPAETSTFDALHEAGRRATEQGLALLHLDIDSDSYPVVLVPYADAYAARGLGEQVLPALVVAFSAVPPPLPP